MRAPRGGDAAPPSVKGALFAPAVAQLRRRLDSGHVTHEQLAERLEPPDERFIEDSLVTVFWYPIDAFDRIVRAVWPDAEAPAREALVRMGRASAQQLLELGAYPSLTATREAWGRHVFNVMASVASSLYNFMRWDVTTPRPGCWTVDIQDAGPWPDWLRICTEGFFAELLEQSDAGNEVRVRSERLDPERARLEVEVRDWDATPA